MSISLTLGDITRVHADAIVNAANPHLAPGGGVCGAIHAAGGPQVAAECRAWVEAHGPVPPGGAAITGAGRLPARRVIHAVGPVWHGGGDHEAEILASAYRSAIALAEAEGLTSVAFPSISTGIYGYPVAAAAPVALRAVHEALAGTEHVRDVTFVLFDEPTRAAYERALAELGRSRP
ncbi:MAG: O-acetyl-ADP-ribose deacetylase [Coriobacteriaceae bacterium]|nr:O-acetyl-ADP-ribose deacetylase [Coriobacteriaceae bacterium]